MFLLTFRIETTILYKMSRKGQNTTTTYLDWNDFIYLITKLEKDENYKFCLLISIGVFTGLRISDLLT